MLSGAYLQVETETGTEIFRVIAHLRRSLPSGATVDGELHMPSIGRPGSR